MMLTTIDHYSAQIDQLTARIEKLAEPDLHQIQQFDVVPGIGWVCAQAIIAEIGAAVGEAAISTSRTQSFLGARCRRLAKRMPRKKAGRNRQLQSHERPRVLANPDASYHDLGPEYYEHHLHTRRQARNHIRSL